MSNHHFHRSAGPFTILRFYCFISIRFQAEVFTSRVARPECRTTIFTGRPDRLFYDFTVSFPFGSRPRFLHLGSRDLNVEPPLSPIGRTLPEFFGISNNKSCMLAHVFALGPNVSPREAACCRPNSNSGSKLSSSLAATGSGAWKPCSARLCTAEGAADLLRADGGTRHQSRHLGGRWRQGARP